MRPSLAFNVVFQKKHTPCKRHSYSLSLIRSYRLDKIHHLILAMRQTLLFTLHFFVECALNKLTIQYLLCIYTKIDKKGIPNDVKCDRIQPARSHNMRYKSIYFGDRIWQKGINTVLSFDALIKSLMYL